MLKIIVLNDDRCDNEKLLSSHGLSLYINKDNFEFLFDVGQDDYFLKNAESLGISFDNINNIVLSHGHYDHSEGLKFFDKKVNLICHPNCLDWRKSKRTGKYNGFPFSREEAEKKFNVLYSKSFYNLNDDVIFLGRIKRKNNFECVNFPSVYEDGSDDVVLEDTGIVIKTEKGFVIISGCGHSGICNTIEYAKYLLNINEIYAVIGGFHLKKIDNQVEKTIDYFKNQNIKNIYLGHCTSDLVCEYFKKQLSSSINIEILKVGMEINL